MLKHIILPQHTVKTNLKLERKIKKQTCLQRYSLSGAVAPHMGPISVCVCGCRRQPCIYGTFSFVSARQKEAGHCPEQLSCCVSATLRVLIKVLECKVGG